MNLREIEKNDKVGYIFYVSYDGRKFDSFDENPGKYTVKGEFIRRMSEIGISWAKGVQQAGRTDAGVSAENNLFYISTNFNGDMEYIRNKFNSYGNEVFIKKVIKTLSGIVLPDEISERTYEYRYKLKKTDIAIEEVQQKCGQLSGYYDVSEFTDKKGENLKEHFRNVNIGYSGNKFVITGNSFMPKQIRIMISYILTGEKKPFPSKPLSLTGVKLSEGMAKKIYNEINKEEIPSGIDIIKAEKIDDIIVIYVYKKDKNNIFEDGSERIKELRKKYGKVVVRCMAE